MNTITEDKSFLPITAMVIVVHFILIGWMLYSPFSPPKIVKRERLVVKTVQLSPTLTQEPASIPAPAPAQPKPIEKSLPAPVPVPEPVQATPLSKTIEPEKKVETPKKVEAKKPTPKPAPSPAKKVEKTVTENKSKPVKKTEPVKKEPIKPTPKPVEKKATPPKVAEKPKVDPQIEAAKNKAQLEAQEKQKKLIAAAQENIAKITQDRAKMGSTKVEVSSPVAAISSLQIEALPEGPQAPALTPGEKSYRDEIAGRLKLLLKLPEHGDVQLKLTLDRSGKVLKVNVTKSHSEHNRSYIEKTLPSLTFPSFGSHFGKMSEYTFTIQLSSE